MAEYQQRYREIQSLGANVVAISVDAPDKSEALKSQLSLNFAILCDTEGRVIRDWDIYNCEKGGIAKPAVFIIDAGQVVRYAAVDTTVNRVSAAEIAFLLHDLPEGQLVRRKVHIPLLSDWSRALRNIIQR